MKKKRKNNKNIETSAEQKDLSSNNGNIYLSTIATLQDEINDLRSIKIAQENVISTLYADMVKKDEKIEHESLQAEIMSEEIDHLRRLLTSQAQRIEFCMDELRNACDDFYENSHGFEAGLHPEVIDLPF